MTSKYLEVILDYYLNEKKTNYIEVSSFLRETGLDRMVVIKHLRNSEWKEKTIGVFSKS